MLQMVLLATAVSMDTLFAAMGCTMSGIFIPRRYAILVGMIGTAMLGISFAGAACLEAVLPAQIFRIAGALLLALLGMGQLWKQAIHKIFDGGRQICLHWKGLELAVQICFDETKADADGSKMLSLGETLAFSTALSLDSLVSGMGAGISGGQYLPCLLLSFVLGTSAMLLGCLIGTRCRKQQNLSWIGGILLLLLAALRFMTG